MSDSGLVSDNNQLRVLVVRLGAMGDILHSLPAVAALRQAHPLWLIGWAVEPRWAGLLSAFQNDATGAAATVPGGRRPEMPVVDCVHLVNAKKWGRKPFSRHTWQDVARVRRELRSGHYDVCVDPQGAVRSAVIGRFAGAARMIGEDRPREWAARFFFNERVTTQGKHVIEQALEVASAVAGERLAHVHPELPRAPADERWCEDWLRVNAADRFVLLNPGAGWGAKRWPARRYGMVAGQLKTLGYKVVVNAGPAESWLVDQVVASSGCGAASVVGVSPSLGQLIAITRRAALVIAGDTGPLHLANALGRPVVGIFGPTDPARNGPFGGEFRVLRHPGSRRDHARRDQPEHGLLTISADAVFEAAAELLAAGQDRARLIREPVEGKS